MPSAVREHQAVQPGRQDALAAGDAGEQVFDRGGQVQQARMRRLLDKGCHLGVLPVGQVRDYTDCRNACSTAWHRASRSASRPGSPRLRRRRHALAACQGQSAAQGVQAMARRSAGLRCAGSRCPRCASRAAENPGPMQRVGPVEPGQQAARGRHVAPPAGLRRPPGCPLRRSQISGENQSPALRSWPRDQKSFSAFMPALPQFGSCTGPSMIESYRLYAASCENRTRSAPRNQDRACVVPGSPGDESDLRARIPAGSATRLQVLRPWQKSSRQ